VADILDSSLPHCLPLSDRIYLILILYQYALCGGVASAFSSVLTTPFDVVKTRLATGVVPAGTPVFIAMKGVVAAEGLKGLFAGVQARVLMSALFGGVGFASFEACKRQLGVVTPLDAARSP
jgi:Mitochondrial carrier protein